MFRSMIFLGGFRTNTYKSHIHSKRNTPTTLGSHELSHTLPRQGVSKELETNGFGKKILWVREMGVMLLIWE